MVSSIPVPMLGTHIRYQVTGCSVGSQIRKSLGIPVQDLTLVDKNPTADSMAL